jgi:hypothetical protein
MNENKRPFFKLMQDILGHKKTKGYVLVGGLLLIGAALEHGLRRNDCIRHHPTNITNYESAEATYSHEQVIPTISREAYESGGGIGLAGAAKLKRNWENRPC